MSFKNFLLSDIFDISTTRSVDKNKIEFKDNAPYDFIGRTSVNWGIQGAIDKLDFEPNPKDSFSLVQVGETVALWRNKEWYASQNLFLLQPKLQKIKDVFLYFQAVINKEMSLYGKDYNSYPTMKSLNKTYISLPVKTEYSPNFALMSEISGGGIDMSNIDTSSWKEFRLDDILQKVDTVKIPLKKGECPVNPTETYTIPARTATTSNHGLGCYVPAELCTVLKNKISVSANGDFCAFWHDSDFTILQDSYALEGKGFELTEKIALFLISTMMHSFSSKYNWNNKSGWEKLKNDVIQLPVKETEEIDWEYMQERITELEQERITELEQYLVTTGLNDYELTDEDIETLSLSGFGNYEERDSEDAVKVCKEFKVIDIANVEYGNKFDKNKMTSTNPTINFVSRTATNNGISDFVDNNGTTPYQAGLITLALGGSIGSCFLQEAPFYTGQNVGVIDLGDIDIHAKIYFTEALGNKCKKSFNAFGNEINKHLKTDLSVSLPIQTDINNNPIIDSECKYHPDGYIPDWDFMESYIRAIEKTVIADVVKYKDAVISKTKEAVA